jgi:hypothetical protein
VRRCPKPRLTFGQNTATPEGARRAVARALDQQNKRLAGAKAEAVDVQLLGRVAPALEWPKLLAYCERRNPSGVAAWPRHLESGAYSLNLWPLPAGRVGRAADLGGDVRKRQPKRLLCAPGLTVFDADMGSGASTALAVIRATWLEDVGTSDLQALRLAPPVLETWATGERLISRDFVDFDLDWSLPAADGI